MKTATIKPTKHKLRSPLKWHPDWPGYGADTEGNIYSAIPGRRPRTLKPWTKRCGHLCVSLRRNGKTHRVLAHRFVLEVFVGPCPPGMECLHGDDGPAVNALRNIHWGTRRDNTIDRFRQGLRIKLAEDDVRAIRTAGYPLGPSAKKYGVTETLVSLILRRKVWTHVD